MEEIGVGLINQQAADVKSIDYPAWAGEGWRVGNRLDQDEHGYDTYELIRGEERIVVPANRIMLMKTISENWADE